MNSSYIINLRGEKESFSLGSEAIKLYALGKLKIKI